MKIYSSLTALIILLAASLLLAAPLEGQQVWNQVKSSLVWWEAETSTEDPQQEHYDPFFREAETTHRNDRAISSGKQEVDEGEEESNQENGESEKEETSSEEPSSSEESSTDQSSQEAAESDENSNPEENQEQEEEEEQEEEQESSTSNPEPSFNWGASRSYDFQVVVTVTNQGEDPSQNTRVELPMLENQSPYQETTLVNTSHQEIDSSGRVSTFDLGEIGPGETKELTATYSLEVTPVSVNSTNDTLEKAREIFERHAGSGNCHDLARAFVNDAQNAGIQARIATGFARPQQGHMTPGSLEGTRHSWAEFHVDGLGWVPADLTFQYFAEFPYASHLLETYSANDSIRIQGTGGQLTGSWSNYVE